MTETYQQRQARLRREAERRSSATYTRNTDSSSVVIDTTDYSGYSSSSDSCSDSSSSSSSDSGSCSSD